MCDESIHRSLPIFEIKQSARTEEVLKTKCTTLDVINNFSKNLIRILFYSSKIYYIITYTTELKSVGRLKWKKMINKSIRLDLNSVSFLIHIVQILLINNLLFASSS